MKVKPFQFSYDAIHVDDQEEIGPWFDCSMISTCEPLFDDLDSNYDVEARLKKAGVITKENQTDTESCALVLNFRDVQEGREFIDRLNAYLVAKAKAMEDARNM